MRAPWPTQVLFLLYHYFNAGEMYNAIRVFIAAYVWMTGFGNYLYYYKTNDFSGVRCILQIGKSAVSLNMSAELHRTSSLRSIVLASLF